MPFDYKKEYKELYLPPQNPQLLEECKKDELVYSESTSDGVKMVEQGYVDKIFRNKEEGKNGKSKKK